MAGVVLGQEIVSAKSWATKQMQVAESKRWVLLETMISI